MNELKRPVPDPTPQRSASSSEEEDLIRKMPALFRRLGVYRSREHRCGYKEELTSGGIKVALQRRCRDAGARPVAGRALPHDRADDFLPRV
ncbi:hypothetical protein E2C01_084666 [Portunus trituberculatus]|uniref:Uncharacterized protein n=1 Tax=Portunus trituberculatus TaxID=210409 RepID=A0A5B7J4T5_PORTR|nr:hypothetical protein [Portunus trituberculatus]